MERLDELEIVNPYKALIEEENVYLLTVGDGDLQKKYLESAYGLNIKSVLVEKQGDLNIYKFEKRMDR